MRAGSKMSQGRKEEHSLLCRIQNRSDMEEGALEGLMRGNDVLLYSSYFIILLCFIIVRARPVGYGCS